MSKYRLKVTSAPGTTTYYCPQKRFFLFLWVNLDAITDSVYTAKKVIAEDKNRVKPTTEYWDA
jgi:hypothetical protein